MAACGTLQRVVHAVLSYLWTALYGSCAFPSTRPLSLSLLIHLLNFDSSGFNSD